MEPKLRIKTFVETISPVPNLTTIIGAHKESHRPKSRPLRSLNHDLKSEEKQNSTSSYKSFTYTAILCAFIGVILIGIGAVIVVRYKRSSSRSKQVNQDVSHQTSASRHRASKQQQAVSNRRLVNPYLGNADSLEVIINPVRHCEELADFERKFCYYDRQIYDGIEDRNPSDAGDNSDVQEDVIELNPLPQLSPSPSNNASQKHSFA